MTPRYVQTTEEQWTHLQPEHIQDLVFISKFGPNDDKFSFVLIKCQKVLTHPKVYFFNTELNTKFCHIKTSTAISIEGNI